MWRPRTANGTALRFVHPQLHAIETCTLLAHRSLFNDRPVWIHTRRNSRQHAQHRAPGRSRYYTSSVLSQEKLQALGRKGLCNDSRRKPSTEFKRSSQSNSIKVKYIHRSRRRGRNSPERDGLHCCSCTVWKIFTRPVKTQAKRANILLSEAGFQSKIVVFDIVHERYGFLPEEGAEFLQARLYFSENPTHKQIAKLVSQIQFSGTF